MDEAIEHYRAALRCNPDYPEIHNNLALALAGNGKLDEAIGEFQIASKGGPMELKCLEMIALCYLEKNEPAAAARR
jgi:tetratricopeptide (TPR) repeat protein